MPNQRKEGIVRISVTMAEQLLHAVESEARAAGADRLIIIRDALHAYLAKRGRLPKSLSNAKKGKPQPKAKAKAKSAKRK